VYRPKGQLHERHLYLIDTQLW